LVPAAPAVTSAPVVPTRPQAEQIPLTMPKAAPQATQAAQTTQATAPAASARVPVAPRETPAPAPASPPLAHRERIRVPVEENPARKRMWMAIAPAAAVVLIALGWHFAHKPAAPTDASRPVTTISQVGQPTGAPPAAQASAPAIETAPSPRTDNARNQLSGAGDEAHRWHVVAFTYNHQDQAQHKADQLAQRNASLRPEVFSPSGHAPYLVTLGGPMTRDEAAQFKAKAAGAGIPRDTYIQNYRRAR
jgi:hypothetical protein